MCECCALVVCTAWRKCLCLGETGGHYCALVRLEDMAMPGRGWKKWLCLGEAGGNGHPSPCRYFSKADLFLQGKTLFLGFAIVA